MILANTAHAALRAIAVLLLAAACSRDTGDGKDSAKRDSASAMADMANMPGMSGTADTSQASSSTTFSAAQIANGHVQWAPPERAAISGVIEVTGQLVPNEDRTARLAAPAQARVLRVHVSPGERVDSGARLVTMQSQEASMAQADVMKATAEVTSRRSAAAYAKAARERADRLLALKAIPRQDYERAIADDEAAQAGARQAEAELQRAQSNAEQLGVDPRDGSMTLRSPIAGVVTARDAVPGAVVGAGTALMTITDPTALWLVVAIPEGIVSDVRIGSSLHFNVAPYPADTFAARVQSVSAAYDATTRSLPIRAAVENPRARLRPEMYARVWIEATDRSAAISVPDSAIQRLDGKTVVFVAHPDSQGGARFEKRVVQVGGSANGRTSIVSGLTPSDRVVVTGAYAVKAQLAKAKMPKMEM